MAASADTPIALWAATNGFEGQAREKLLEAADTVGDLLEADTETLELCLERAAWKKLSWCRFSRLLDDARRENAAAPPAATEQAAPATLPTSHFVPAAAAPTPRPRSLLEDEDEDSVEAGAAAVAESDSEDDDVPVAAEEDDDDSESEEEEEEDAPPRKRPRTTAAARPRASRTSKYYGELAVWKRSCGRYVDATPPRRCNL